ncbi:DinB family protein [Thiorhodococcus mannitoliphagus]|uniref:DinB family protein n=1 Tax=Thiorhodococcus mannitoliphagus TaxID=329406 RepID=A0A6P1DSV5_9GAMM|nr:DinB family protein [Thiorhodococcus mannitoliphagus]NEX21387.1 DinB family protein [Thiorhodococcus mannitoliphagus]
MMPRGRKEPAGAGAGIPAHERLAASIWVRFYASFASPGKILEQFRSDAERALTLARRLSEEAGTRPVCIRRFPGIEAESRDWSVYMTLDHLVMINTAITALIHAICSARGHGVEIRVEDVKPHPDAGPDRIPALEALVERYAHQIDCLGLLQSCARYPHPWFGPLTARQWHALAALHNRIHRLQIEKIIDRLD